MCLSKVYIGGRSKEKIIIEEAAKVKDNHGTVEIYSIFGEVEKQKNCFIKEVDLEDNYIILERKAG
jgi:predicted RNA-binding protein